MLTAARASPVTRNLTSQTWLLTWTASIVVTGFAYSSTTGSQILVARYDEFGALDTTFGDLDPETGGRTGFTVVTLIAGRGTTADTVAIQDDGKIVVAGDVLVDVEGGVVQGHQFVARLEADGSSLDTGFGFGGWTVTEIGNGCSASSVMIQPNVDPDDPDEFKILAVGTTNNYYAGNERSMIVVRYRPDGSLDLGFNPN